MHGPHSLFLEHQSVLGPGPAAWALKSLLAERQYISLCKVPSICHLATQCVLKLSGLFFCARYLFQSGHWEIQVPGAVQIAENPPRLMGDERENRGMNTQSGGGESQVLTSRTQLCTKIPLVVLRGLRTLLSVSSSQSPCKHPYGLMPQGVWTWS